MNKKNNQEMKNDIVVENNINEEDSKNGYIKECEAEIERAVVEDPLFAFLKKWSNLFFWICIIVAGGFLGYREFQDVREQDKMSYADNFSTLRTYYANVVKLQKDVEAKKIEITKAQEEKQGIENKEKDLKDLQKELDESLKIATESSKTLLDSKDYNKIATIYSAMIYKLKGDDENFNKEISSMNWQDFDTELDDAQKYYKELCAVVMAKDYVEKEKNEEAKELLTKIAKNGKYFNAVAFRTLNYISASSEAEAIDSLRSEISANHPGLSSLIK